MSEAELQKPVDITDEATLEKLADTSLASLSFDERESLSKALFPETHTERITLLGKERLLRPLPIKFSRKVYTLTKPLIDKFGGATISEGEVGQQDETIYKNLCEVVKTVAEFYGESWNDVVLAINDEMVSLVELEQVALEQVHLNSVNDFLLRPLRVLIRFLQVTEIMQTKAESLQNTTTLPRRLSDGSAVLTNSSPNTPMGN